MATPIVLTSILPFGIVKKDGKKWYRFSVSVDLSSAYPQGDDPDYQKLQTFLKSYGVGPNSIYSQILDSLVIRIDSRSVPGPPPWRLCFPQSFDATSVEKHWQLLFGIGTARALSISGFNYDTPTQQFTPNPLIGKKVEQFQNADDPYAIYGKLVAAQERLNAALAKVADKTTAHDPHGPDEIKNAPNQVSVISNEILSSVESESGDIFDNIRKTGEFLKGFDNFAQPQNSIEAQSYLNRKIEGFRENLLNAPDYILEAFSFINSNIILQRLFGTTIDFEIAEEETGLATVADGSHGFEIEPGFARKISDGTVEWRFLKTAMVYHQKTSGSAVLLKRTIAKSQYFPANYDYGAKLRSLSDLDAKIKGIKAQLQKAKTESEFYAVRKELIALDSAALTRGMNLYNRDIEAEFNEILSKMRTLETTNTEALLEENVTRGLRFGVKSVKEGSTEILPLGSRKVELVEELGASLPDEFKVQEFAVHVDTGAHSLVERVVDQGGDGPRVEVEHKIVVDNCVLTWSGENIGMPSVFSNTEKDDNFKAEETEGSVSTSADVVTKAFSRIFKEETFPKSVQYGVDMAAGGIADQDESAKRPITLQYRFNRNAKLLLGKTHDVCAVPEYKNGWGVRFNTTDVSGDGSVYELGYDDLPDPVHTHFKFKRNEPVKPICFYLQDPLFEQVPGKVGFQTPAKGRDGESLQRLVIRNYSSDNDWEYKTTQKTVRHILPPPISFEQAFWHGKIFEIHKEYGRNESHRWYEKHHFPINEGDDRPNNGGKYTYEESVDGSTRMREFYPDRWYIPDGCEKGDIINYLPDPLSKGFRLEFFLDDKRTIKAADYKEFEQNEYYFTGKYPYIRAWKIIIEDKDDHLVEVYNEEIRIRVPRGAELFVRARTILDESYEDQFEAFGNYNDFTRYGGNDLLCPPLDFSIVHATLRPLVRPKLNNTLRCEKEIGKSFVTMTHTLNLEQLGIYPDRSGIIRYIDDTLPTGSVELYAKWEEYEDDPKHQTTDDWTPHKPVNKVDLSTFRHKPGESPASFETAINFSPEQLVQMEKTLNRINDDPSSFKNYAVDITAAYELNTTKFLEKWFWIKNKSKFSSYYPTTWGIEEETDANLGTVTSRNVFNRISTEPFLVRILNSKKPGKPILADRNIILLTVVDDLRAGSQTTRTTRMTRLRFYFERNRLKSGKGERIGFVVNEARSKYNDFLVANGLISKVGRDITADSIRPYDGLYRNEDVLLNKSNFVIHDPVDLSTEDGEKAADLESFSAEYVEDLGIMTYLPKFDKKLNLWYLDVELDINDKNGNELHSPFLQFGMVHYQEHSFNYNNLAGADLGNDCRISEINMSGFVYLMGSRVIYIDQVSRKELKVKISADPTSLIKHSADTLRTRFFAAIEQKAKNDIKWKALQIDGQSNEVIELSNEQAFSLPLENNWGVDYRLVILETEYWVNQLDPVPDKISHIYDNQNYRVILVNIFNF